MNIRRSAARAVSILFVGAVIGCMNTGEPQRDGRVGEGSRAVVSESIPEPYPNGSYAICHVPPGNPANAHTIHVAPSAVDAHLDHGDYEGACACHALCEEGEPLTWACDPCVKDICKEDPYCCDVFWDDLCVDEVESICELDCGSGGCTHGPCDEGEPLDPSCGSCEQAVCDYDPYCCDVYWDLLCVSEAQQLCLILCL